MLVRLMGAHRPPKHHGFNHCGSPPNCLQGACPELHASSLPRLQPGGGHLGLLGRGPADRHSGHGGAAVGGALLLLLLLLPPLFMAGCDLLRWGCRPCGPSTTRIPASNLDPVLCPPHYVHSQVRNAASLCYTALLVRVLGFRNAAGKVRTVRGGGRVISAHCALPRLAMQHV